jgi:hypothetical protein
MSQPITQPRPNSQPGVPTPPEDAQAELDAQKSQASLNLGTHLEVVSQNPKQAMPYQDAVDEVLNRWVITAMTPGEEVGHWNVFYKGGGSALEVSYADLTPQAAAWLWEHR